MAITKIWPVKDNLSRVYRYISNEDNISDGLNEVLTYTTQGYKTNEKEYITGINCASHSSRMRLHRMSVMRSVSDLLIRCGVIVLKLLYPHIWTGITSTTIL